MMQPQPLTQKGRTKLSPAQVKEIHDDYAAGTRVEVIAVHYGVSTATVYKVLKLIGGYKELQGESNE